LYCSPGYVVWQTIRAKQRFKTDSIFTLLVTIDRVLDWMIGFIDTLYIVLGTVGNYSAIVILHAFQFTVPYALGFSVFPSRILATELSQFHWHFKSHMKYSFRSLIPFLALILRLPIPKTRLNSIPSSQAHIPTGWHLDLDPSLPTRLFCFCYSYYMSSDILCPFIIPRHEPHGNPLHCQGCVFTGPLHSNGYPVVAYAYVTGMCLPSRCLAMGMHIHSIIVM
jgi:hypothetical protein